MRLLFVFLLPAMEQGVMLRNGVEKREGGMLIFCFVRVMLKQIEGIFRAESCFKYLAIFHLESLINLYLHEQKLLSLSEDTEQRLPSSLQPSQNPQCYS